MGILHIGITAGAKGKGASRVDYLTREGYFNKDKLKQELLTTECFNLPYWADSPKEFFAAADQYERKNGNAFRQFIISLPNELDLETNKRLVKEFIDDCIGTDKVTLYAIHDKEAEFQKLYLEYTAEENIQPSHNIHAHIMFSERIITDTPESIKDKTTFFKRYDKKNPEKSGYKKDERYTSKRNLTSKHIIFCRKHWAELVNREYEKHNIPERLNPDSLQQQYLKANLAGDIEMAELLKPESSTYIPSRYMKALLKDLKEINDSRISSNTEKIIAEQLKDVDREIASKEKNNMPKLKLYPQREKERINDIKGTRLADKLVSIERRKKIKALKLQRAQDMAILNEPITFKKALAQAISVIRTVRENISKTLNRITGSKYYSDEILQKIAFNIHSKGLYNILYKNKKRHNILMHRIADNNKKLKSLKPDTPEYSQALEIKKQNVTLIRYLENKNKSDMDKFMKEFNTNQDYLERSQSTYNRFQKKKKEFIEQAQVLAAEDSKLHKIQEALSCLLKEYEKSYYIREVLIDQEIKETHLKTVKMEKSIDIKGKNNLTSLTLNENERKKFIDQCNNFINSIKDNRFVPNSKIGEKPVQKVQKEINKKDNDYTY